MSSLSSLPSNIFDSVWKGIEIYVNERPTDSKTGLLWNVSRDSRFQFMVVGQCVLRNYSN
jgi:hypothetical protein